MMVQDWQYWGKYGWNAMRFDEDNYPDPAGLVDDLHAIDMRLMLSVWSKVGRETELGKEVAARSFYIPGTEWVDFFNPDAADFYADVQNRRLAALGIDAWWQDATEPENDDLIGRRITVGPGQTEPGEFRRNIYPLQVSRAVYQRQRRGLSGQARVDPDPFRRARSDALCRGDMVGRHRQRLGNATPADPAGLNMAAAGYPWWTVDAGGFFRPGDGQYADPAYHERFLRWFQFATFLPLQRVHGYMTDTEFWRYGEMVETVARTISNCAIACCPTCMDWPPPRRTRARR